ncbi:MAG TPA: c-type cytochrome, partial [Longimicrobiales bacterium]|nr:c-type cytochrome [Longimicrobiales bacterium]
MRDTESDRRSLRRWEWAGVVVGLVLVAAFPAYRAVEATQRDEWAAERRTALVALGHDLWLPDCAACHGENGEGVDAPALNSQQFL